MGKPDERVLPRRPVGPRERRREPLAAKLRMAQARAAGPPGLGAEELRQACPHRCVEHEEVDLVCELVLDNAPSCAALGKQGRVEPDGALRRIGPALGAVKGVARGLGLRLARQTEQHHREKRYRGKECEEGGELFASHALVMPWPGTAGVPRFPPLGLGLSPVRVRERKLSPFWRVGAQATRARVATSRSCSTPSGSSTRTVVPALSTLSSAIRPRCRSTIAFVIASPRPVPGIACSVALELRKKRSKSCACSCEGIPSPVSSTSSTACPFAAVSRTSTLPPFGVNLSAFEMRLSSTWASRARSPSSLGTGSAWAVSLIPWATAIGDDASMHSSTMVFRSTVSSSMASLPASTWARKSRSLTRSSSRCELRSTTPIKRRWSSVSSPASSSRSSV